MGTTAFGVISMAALVIFMLGDYRSYPMVYGTGLMILIFFMVKLLFAEIAQVYRTQMQANIYKEMAYLDALTGLQNRNAYIRDTSAITDTEGLGIIILDINNVKYVNDTYGHECGDMMIRAAADVIKHAFGSLGAAYRIGGDEFAVICHRVDEDAIKRAIAMADVLQRDYHCKDEIRLSIAVGYAVDGIPGAGESVSSLMAKADENMYEDKAVKKKHL
ncbi:MAG: GGDEF domain-containing protein [Aristaeellaceae bacterium]